MVTFLNHIIDNSISFVDILQSQIHKNRQKSISLFLLNRKLSSGSRTTQDFAVTQTRRELQ